MIRDSLFAFRFCEDFTGFDFGIPKGNGKGKRGLPLARCHSRLHGSDLGRLIQTIGIAINGFDIRSYSLDTKLVKRIGMGFGKIDGAGPLDIHRLEHFEELQFLLGELLNSLEQIVPLFNHKDVSGLIVHGALFSLYPDTRGEVADLQEEEEGGGDTGDDGCLP